MSDAQVAEGLEAAGFDQADTDIVLAIYDDARVDAFRTGITFLLFVALAGLILSSGLPNKMLVEAEA